MNLVDLVNKEHANKNVESFPIFRSGDTLAVHLKIKEGDKSRVQVFEGQCISVCNRGHMNGHFRLRKVSGGVGVERVIPFHGPNVVKIEVVNRGKSRRSKHYYLRGLSTKSARLDQDYDREV